MLTQTITTGQTEQIHADAMFDAVFDHALGFRIDMSYPEAQAFIRRIDQYNEFEAGSVLDALDEIDRLLPKRYFNPGNPNNGGRSFKISVGREGSPVIYIEMYEYEEFDALTEDTLKAVCQEMTVIGRADESDYEVEPLGGFGGRKITFRFWWD